MFHVQSRGNKHGAHLDALINFENFEAVPVTEI